MRADDGRVVTNFIVQVLAGRPLTVYGDGLQTRSFCYIDDMVEGLVRLMDSDRAGSRPMNLGNPEEFTIRELAALVMELSERHVPLDRRPLPEDDPKRRRPSIERAQTLIGWAPTIPLRDGLLPTIRHFERDLARVPVALRDHGLGSISVAAAE